MYLLIIVFTRSIRSFCLFRIVLDYLREDDTSVVVESLFDHNDRFSSDTSATLYIRSTVSDRCRFDQLDIEFTTPTVYVLVNSYNVR